jgi:hypothetical protein
MVRSAAPTTSRMLDVWLGAADYQCGGVVQEPRTVSQAASIWGVMEAEAIGGTSSVSR